MKHPYPIGANYLELMRIASEQCGVFTAKQAIGAGFDRRKHSFYVRAGYWRREYRGIYRLVIHPSDLNDHYMVWHLWSCNRKGHPQGVYSHETALSMYELTDLDPHKIHMTVPPAFRRSAQKPGVIVLHRNKLAPKDWRDLGGYRATTPARTLYDVINCGYISGEFIYQAVEEGLSRGLYLPKELARYRIIRKTRRILSMNTLKYSSGSSFRNAIDDHVRNYSVDWNVTKQRLFRHVSFERFLSRLFSINPTPCLLKGGYAMELLLWNYYGEKNFSLAPTTIIPPTVSEESIDLGIRLNASRTTKDIDIALTTKTTNFERQFGTEMIKSVINNIINKDLGDFFSFRVIKKRALDNHPVNGISFTIESTLAGKVFSRFKVDIVEENIEIPGKEQLEPPNLTRFANIICPKMVSITREQQFAEKIHAYTRLRRGYLGSRVKDLIDMVLLLENLKINKAKLAFAIRTVFEARHTHPIPEKLPAPPEDWQKKFPEIAKACHIQLTIEEAFKIVANFYSSLTL